MRKSHCLRWPQFQPSNTTCHKTACRITRRNLKTHHFFLRSFGCLRSAGPWGKATLSQENSRITVPSVAVKSALRLLHFDCATFDRRWWSLWLWIQPKDLNTSPHHHLCLQLRLRLQLHATLRRNHRRLLFLLTVLLQVLDAGVDEAIDAWDPKDWSVATWCLKWS